VPRPRQPEDPALFEAHREIMGVLELTLLRQKYSWNDVEERGNAAPWMRGSSPRLFGSARMRL
jgi:hypothetical protein